MKDTSRRSAKFGALRVLGSPAGAIACLWIVVAARAETVGAEPSAGSALLAQSADMLSAIDAEAESGAIDAALASMYRYAACFDRALLPERFAGLPAPALRCATPVLKEARAALGLLPARQANALESSIAGLTNCTGGSPYPFVKVSVTHPIKVWYRVFADQATATAALAHAEDAWDVMVNDMGFTAPLLDGGACGNNEAIDIYLDRNADYAYTLDVLPNPGTPWDDWACFIAIDPQVFGGEYLRGTVWHELNHAMQAADDWWEVGASFEATASTVEELANDADDFYVNYLPDFTSRPHRPFEFYDAYTTLYMYGACQQLLFYRDRYFAGSLEFIGEMWRGARSEARGCYCHPERNEPDMLDSLDALLRARAGTTYAEALVEFSRWRWFTGARDDGDHFEEGGQWPDDASVRLLHSETVGAAPVVLEAGERGPLLNGAAYARLRFARPGTWCVRFDAASASSGEWRVESLRPRREAQWTPRLIGNGAFEVNLDAPGALVLMVVRIGDGTYDPDFAPGDRGDFRLVVSPSGNEGCACVGDADGDGAVTIGDVEMVISAWGTGLAPADLDASGLVDFADLSLVLTLFGARCEG